MTELIRGSLIAAPEKFDGALVTVVGYCVARFEHVAIHGSDEPIVWAPSIWLHLDDFQKEKINGEGPVSCKIKGVFREGPTGHMSRWPAEINPVTEIVVY